MPDGGLAPASPRDRVAVWPSERVPRRARWIGAVAVWALGACFVRLGAPAVLITNEAREGVYARAMIRSGSFIAPEVPNHLENGEIILDKPPLFHWLAALATAARAVIAGGDVTGEALSRSFDEWTLRFPSALSAVLMAIAVASLGAPFVGERASLYAAAALLTSTQFGYQARFGRVDMALACFGSIAALLAGRALLDEREKKWLPLAGAAAGLAVLAKGPLGALLPALGSASFLLAMPLLGESPAAGRALPWKTALAVLALVTLPWYGAAAVASRGAVIRSQILAENVTQFIGPDGRMNELFYAWPWLLDSFPWNLLAVASLFALWKRREPGALFCAFWWLSTLAFFQMAAYKRRAYLLPALPAEALLAGWFLDSVLLAGHPRGFSDVRASLHRLVRLALICACAAAVGALVAPRAGQGPMRVPRLDAALAFGGAGAAALAVASLVSALRADERWQAVVATWTALGVLNAVLLPTGLAVITRSRSAKPMVERIEAALPADARLRICGIDPDPTLPILFYFRDPERIDVLSEGAPCRGLASPGFFLLPASEWQRLRQSGEGSATWVERWRGELMGWERRLGVVLAERVVSDAGGAGRLAQQ